MTDPIIGSLLLGWTTLLEYLSQHVVTCLIPAFFIAGAIASFIKKDAILKYFSPETKKTTSYGIASISGTVLAVCSCTILPMCTRGRRSISLPLFILQRCSGLISALPGRLRQSCSLS